MKIDHQPFLIIISSPSGAGKTTLCKKVIENDKSIVMSISTTTRSKRVNEVDGVDYKFVSSAEFAKLKNNNSFLESAVVFGNNYGTLKESVEKILQNNKSVLFDIDWQGARQIRKNFNQDQVISIFILPPSIAELEKRLNNRAQDSNEVVKSRMQKALDEIDHFNEYNYVLINDNLDNTFKEVISIIEAKKISLRNHSIIEALIKKSFK